MSTKHKSTTRLSLVTQLTTKLSEQVTLLEAELSGLSSTATGSSAAVTESNMVLSDLRSIRKQMEILNLKERYLTRANHRLRQQIKHLNHQLTSDNVSSLSSLHFLPSQSSLCSLPSASHSRQERQRADSLRDMHIDTGHGGRPATPSFDAYYEDFANLSAVSLTSQATPSLVSVSDAEMDTDASIASAPTRSSQEFTVYDKGGRSQATIHLFGATLLSWKVLDPPDSVGNNIGSIADTSSGAIGAIGAIGAVGTASAASVASVGSLGSSGVNGMERELMFVSKNSHFDNIHAIRGGIPICFPQFAASGRMPSHGFARVLNWKLKDLGGDVAGIENDLIEFEYCNVDEIERGDTSVSVDRGRMLSLDRETSVGNGKDRNEKDSNDNMGGDIDLNQEPWNWQHKLKLEYSVRVSEYCMYNTLIVSNLNDSDSFEFNVAFHNYFKVANIKDVTVAGLDKIKFYDKVRKMFDEQEGELKIDRETDRIYGDCVDRKIVTLSEDGTDYSIVVKRSDNLKDIVVFNPWMDKAKTMKDFGDEEYKDTVCVETGSVTKESAITVQAGHSIVLSQELQFVLR